MICGALDPWNRPYVTRPKEVLRYTPKQWGWVSTKKAKSPTHKSQSIKCQLP